MEYYEVDVVFEEEVSSKSGIKVRKVRRKYLVQAQSVTASEALVYEFLTDSPYSYEVVSSKKSKIIDVVSSQVYIYHRDIETNVRGTMNAADRKEFDLIHQKIDTIKEDIEKMNKDINNAHQRNDENLKFIKESLFKQFLKGFINASRKISSFMPVLHMLV